MAKIYWHETKQQSREFTSKLLKWWFVRHGGIITGPEDADLVCVSFCSPREVDVLKSARVVASKHGLRVLAGGCEAYTGSTYLAWADYLCVGEGYELLKELASASDPMSILDDYGNVLGSADGLVTPDYHIPWGELPSVQTAQYAFYYLAGRGCRKKCKFCMTSWTQPHQTIPPALLDQAGNQVTGRTKLVYVTNDDGLGDGAGSTTLKNFINSDRDKWPMVTRLGIEGVTEKRRRSFAKPISDEEIAAAIIKAKRIRRQLELFFIVGFPDDPEPVSAFEKIADLIGTETARYPRVYMKFTWFEPCPHTPLANWDLGQLIEWDYQEAAKTLRARSGRYRVFRAGKIGASIWSAVLRRCDSRQALLWETQRDRVSCLPARDVCSEAASLLGAGVIDGSVSPPWKRVKCAIRLNNE